MTISTPAIGHLTTSSPDDVVAAAFGGTVPASEAAAWAKLTPAQRDRAGRRLAALLEWAEGTGALGATDAAVRADVSLSRFYRIAAAWREAPTLAALGTFAAGTGRKTKLVAHAVNALQSALPRVVGLNRGAAVSTLVELLINESGVDREELPGTTKLREMVEGELRRVSAENDAGNAVVFDCVATSLPREDRRPHVLFACIDRGTRTILGIALGDVGDSRTAYVRTARDALDTIASLPLPWGRRLKRMEITAGEDVAACELLIAGLTSAMPGPNFQLASRAKRYGRYLRSLVGPRMGAIVFTPTRTVVGEAMAVNGDMHPWSERDALAAIRSAAEAHNRGLPVDDVDAADCEPPPSLSGALRELAAYPAAAAVVGP